MANKTAQTGGKKLILFRVVAVLLPFLLFFLIEGLLCIGHYGHDLSLFIKDPADENYLVLNPYVSQRYFSDTANATRGNQERFAIHKTVNTCRIFVLGESTTIGYPYMHNGSFHRWLLYRLMHEYPDRNFEIINLSLTAVNSFTVLDMGKQLGAYQPDAVLIYTGHNEYYGALGVGSTSRAAHSAALVRLLIWLRGWRTVQLFNNCISKIGSWFGSQHIDNRENLMKRMAAKQTIAYGSADYRAGIEQFRNNIGNLVKKLDDEGIPVYLSNVVSNEKDLPPFISEPDGKQSANDAFEKGKQSYSKGDFISAKKYFIQAKEYDQLRFRAPEAINQIITDLAHSYRQVHLVDTKALFEEHSPYGIIGNKLLLEHVHPNLTGYALLSEAFYKSMQSGGLFKDKPVLAMSFDTLKKEMPVTAVDSLSGAYQMMMLKAGWPFNQPIPADFRIGNSFEEKLAGKLSVNHISWEEAMNALFQYYVQRNEKYKALKADEALLLEHPDGALLYAYAANLSAGLNDYKNAEFYYRKLFAMHPDAETAQNLFTLYVKMGKPEAALKYIDYAPSDVQPELQQKLKALVAKKGPVTK